MVQTPLRNRQISNKIFFKGKFLMQIILKEDTTPQKSDSNFNNQIAE